MAQPIPRIDDVPEHGRIAVFRALMGLGDFLCAVPSLRALRAARPDVEIALIAFPETEPLARRFGRYVDRFVAFPGFPGIPEHRADVRRLPAFLEEVQALELDVAIQLHGSGELTNRIVCLFGARHVAGYYRAGSPPDDVARFLPWRDDVSEVRRSLRLMAHLGWPSDDESLEFPVADAGQARVMALADEPDGSVLERPFAVINPGASQAARRWPASEFAAVGDGLAAAGLGCVLTGTKGERELTRSVAASMRAPAFDVAGRTDLDTLGALLQRASVLVANDTGVAHLADALRVPSVVVFRDRTLVDRWGPLDRQLHRVSHGPARRVLAEARQLVSDRTSHAA
jgi:ADP-heptose:LPS heptosyltransferase